MSDSNGFTYDKYSKSEQLRCRIPLCKLFETIRRNSFLLLPNKFKSGHS